MGDRPVERSQGGGSVAAVVLARHRELKPNRLELPATNDLRHFGEPALEQLLHLRRGSEGGVVIELDVRDDGDLRP